MTRGRLAVGPAAAKAKRGRKPGAVGTTLGGGVDVVVIEMMIVSMTTSVRIDAEAVAVTVLCEVEVILTMLVVVARL